MRRIPLRVLLFLTVVASLLSLSSCSREPAPRADRDIVVATVNDAPISLQDLKTEIAARRGFTPALSAKSATRGEVSEALRQLIDRAIVLKEGERLGIAVSSSEVDKEVERFRADFPPGGLEKALLQVGMDMEGWRQALARSLLCSKSAEAIAASRASVSAAEVDKVSRRRARQLVRPEHLRVRQYLFASEEEAVKARRMILAGERPEDVMGRIGTGDSRPTVADLGDVTREDLPPEVAADLFSLNEGDASDVVRREQTYSVFLVIGKEPARTLGLDEAARKIREELQNARREEAFRSWLSAQVGKADIRIQETLVERFAGGGK